MKKLLLCLAGFFISCSTLVHAQTLINSGKLEGGAGSDPHISKITTGANGHYVAGWFRDSLDLDPSAAGSYMVYAGTPGNKTAYLAAYTEMGAFQWGFAFNDPGCDSTVINDLAIDFNGNIVLAVTYNNTISIDPLVGPSSYGTLGDFNSLLLFYDPTNGHNVSSIPMGSDPASGMVIKSVYTSGPTIYIGGYLKGSVDMDPTASTSYLTAADQKDAFVAIYNVFGYSYTDGAVFPNTNGNESVERFIQDDGYLYATGIFDQDIELDMAGTGTTYNSASAGTTDIFLVKMNGSFGYILGMTMGDTQNDRPVGFHKGLLMAEFRGTMNIDPLASGQLVTSAGSTDIVAVSYNTGTGAKDWYKQYGNAGDNTGTFLYSRNNSYYMGMSFGGSINTGGNGVGPAVFSNNNPINGVVIEIEPNGNYVENYLVEAQTVKAITTAANDENMVFMMGEFSGSIVDVMPFGGYEPLTTTLPAAGYMIAYNRCHLTVDAVQEGLYECGTCSAVVSSHYTGTMGTPSGSWSYSGGTSSGITVSGMCAGEYFGTITDFHNCTATDSVTVLEHSAGAELNADVNVTNSSCNNNVGSATATVFNAVGDIHFSWSSGDTLISTDSLTAGFYTLVVSDSMNCYVTESFNVSDVDGPSVSLTDTTHLTCSGVSSGAIDITVTGGAAPLSFLWSNGASTEDLTGIAAGTYAVIVTDANGCEAQLCVTVNGPAELGVALVNTIATSACGVADGSLVVDGNGGTAPYTFLWEAAAGSSVNDTVSGLAAGYYSVTVTDAGGCVATNAFGVSETGGPYVGFLGATSPSCSGVLGGIFLDIPDFSVGSVWNTGDPGPHLFNIEDGGKYFLTATHGISGCITIFEYDLAQTPPNTPDLCMVTVDETGTQNVVIWDKTTTPEAEYYNIYREGFCNSSDFLPIGMVDHDSLSVFYDTVVNTDTRSWRYYITAVDTCGYESLPSEINRTIHLTAMATPTFDALLNWEAYIGREVAQYNIFRVDPIDPNLFVKIDSVAGTVLTYTDTTNFNVYVSHDPEWYIEAVPVNPCFASRAFNQNASRSNHTRLGFGIFDTTGVQQLPAIEDLVKVYPNPAHDRLNISVSGHDVRYTGAIMNQVGQNVYQFEMDRSVSISTGHLPQGIYYVRITNALQQNKVYKLVIAH